MPRVRDAMRVAEDDFAGDRPSLSAATDHPSRESMIGRELSHYRITAKLGSGGMGEVFRAEDTKLGRAVALKVLPEEMASDEDRLSRFRREAKIVAGLNHPNIVTLYSVDRADGLDFLTMELVEGTTLGDLMPRDGFPLERIFELAIPIIDAVVCAHVKGVVHRDLKPGNVMVTDEDGRVKVLDFGLATPVGSTDDGELSGVVTLSIAREGLVVGTPLYMSPEQARGQEVDQRSDIFAFGVMLYEMATGERPFRGANSVELLSSVLRDDPPPATDVRSDLPPHLARVIRRCLEKDPDDRYQTARDVLNELRVLKLEVTSGFDRAPISELGARRASGRGSGIRKPVLAAAAVVIASAATLSVMLGLPGGERPPASGSGRQVVAVLPFENLGSEDDEYFADGVTDEITSRLAVIQGLAVISRTSARLYKGTQKPAREIGNELGADFILEGTIRWDRSGDPSRVRITPRLIQVTDDTQLWSDTYEHEIMQIFSVQTEIAERIAGALDVRLVADERQALTAKPTDNIEAYHAYLRGMKQLVSPGFGKEAFELGAQMFERAVTLDPGFALAWARLSSMHSRMYHYGFDRTEDRLEKARTTAGRALALQPTLAEAHVALGHYHYWCEREYAAALEALDTAQELAPANNEVWLTKAYVARRQGDFEGAIELFKRDSELSPLDPNATIGLGETLGTLRRYAEAERAFQRGIALAPADPYPYTELALLYLRWRGDSAAARSVLEAMPPVNSTEVCRVGFLTELLDRRYEAALELLGECPEPVLQAGIFSIPVALFEGMARQLMGEPEQARAGFERSRTLLEERLANDDLDHRTHSALGLTYAGLGRAEEAVRHGLRAVELYPLSKDALEAPSLITDLALIYTMVGQEDAALDQLERVLSVQSIFSASWLEQDPLWDALRDNPRFEELLREHAVDTGT